MAEWQTGMSPLPEGIGGAMDEPRLQITRRRLPHWTLSGSVYFVTFRLAIGSFSESERALVLDHLRAGHGQFYELASAVIMPDHVHLILKPRPGISISRVMKGIKGVSARKLNAVRGTIGRVWQAESWDRIVRDDADFQEKLQYMLDNPVKAGLVNVAEQYSGWYLNPEFL